MLNHREYSFLLDIFKNEDITLFSEISLKYENNYSLFFRHLLDHNLSNKKEVNWLIDEFYIDKASEILFSIKENLIEFIVYNNSLGIKSEIYETLINFEKAEFEFQENELIEGIKISERNTIKQHLNDIDSYIFLTENEIKQGIKIQERIKIKEQFKELDKIHPLKVIYSKREIFNNISKIAAILIIIISIVYFSQNTNFNTSTENIQAKNIQNTELNTILFPLPNVKSFTSSNSFFEQKNLISKFKVLVNSYNTKGAETLKNKLLEKESLTESEKTKLNSLKNNIELYSGKYKVINNKCSIYIDDSKELDLNELAIICLTNNNEYYYFLKSRDKFYSLNSNSKINKLFEIQNPEIVSILNLATEQLSSKNSF